MSPLSEKKKKKKEKPTSEKGKGKKKIGKLNEFARKRRTTWQTKLDIECRGGGKRLEDKGSG